MSKKKIILSVILFALLISIPLTLSQLSKPQEQRSRAAGSVTLSFTPISSTTNPIQATIGSPIDLDMYIDPVNSPVTFLRYQVIFDATKIKPVSANPFDLNTSVFSNVEGPIITSNTISQSISIGSDPTKVITKKTKVGTLHFTAVGNTNGATTSVIFGTISQALSSGADTQASQNVLSTTIPAIITIGGTITQSPSQTPTATPHPTQIPVPTVTGTALNFTLLLHGVGSAGDNPNPTDSTLSNKSPLHPQRNLLVQVFNTSNQVVASNTAPIIYDSDSGTFQGEVGLAKTLPSGNYSIKIQTDRYLRKLIPGIQEITAGQETQVSTTQMVTGDTNNDNVLNILDYNALLDCGYGLLNPLPMNDPNSVFHSSFCQVHTPTEDIDLNDDGVINSTDYNLFLRELSVQNGD